MVPIQDLSVPKGCSTVQRRVRTKSGLRSIRSVASSMMLVRLPVRDPAFLACCTAGFQGAVLAFVLPISPLHQTAFFPRVSKLELFASGANVDIGFGIIGEVGLHKHALPTVARGLWSRNSCRDPSSVAGQNL